MISILGHSADKKKGEEHGGLHFCRHALPPYTPADEPGDPAERSTLKTGCGFRELGPRPIVARGNALNCNPLQRYRK